MTTASTSIGRKLYGRKIVSLSGTSWWVCVQMMLSLLVLSVLARAMELDRPAVHTM